MPGALYNVSTNPAQVMSWPVNARACDGKMVAIATISPSRVINTMTKAFPRVNMHNCTYVASP